MNTDSEREEIAQLEDVDCHTDKLRDVENVDGIVGGNTFNRERTGKNWDKQSEHDSVDMREESVDEDASAQEDSESEDKSGGESAENTEDVLEYIDN
jgi:hypothetical protein